MMLRNLFFLAILCVSFSIRAQEGDAWGMTASEYTFKGFSENNAYAVYEMTEELLHSETQTRLTQIFVINVEKNSYAARPFRFHIDSANERKYKRGYDSVYNVIKVKYGVSGTQQGTALSFKELPNKDSVTTKYKFRAGETDYILVVTLVPESTTDGYDPMGAKMVKVDLISPRGLKTLQPPEKAPSSWGVTDTYSLIGGWVRDNKIALFLNYETSPFEGPGQRHQMIVTGVLN